MSPRDKKLLYTGAALIVIPTLALSIIPMLFGVFWPILTVAVVIGVASFLAGSLLVMIAIDK